jgi:hypothetical protein
VLGHGQAAAEAEDAAQLLAQAEAALAGMREAEASSTTEGIPASKSML